MSEWKSPGITSGGMSIDELLDAYHRALKEQASANSDLAAAEDTLEVIQSELLAAAEGSEWKAKATARASSTYKAHLKDVIDAREAAEKARGEVEYLRARFEAWRTKMSMQKVMRQMGG